MTKAQVMREYMKYRGLRNHSLNSLADIENQINKFITHTKKPLDAFTESMLMDYVGKINSKYKTNTANTIKSSFLKNFIKWHYEDWSSRFRNLNAICATEKPAPTYKPEDMLTEEDVQKLIKGEDSTFWKAYFLTLFYAGCRPVEVVNLKWESVEFTDDGAYITIYSKKNKQTFIKYVPADVSFYLEKLKGNESEFIFCNPRTKKPIGVKGAYWKLRQISERVLGKKINLYILRHSIATIIYNKEGLKDDDVAIQMGHTKSMRSTYVHNDKNKLKENARRIYFKPEDMPEEKKHELMLDNERIRKDLEDFKKQVQPLIDSNEKKKKEVHALAREMVKEAMAEAQKSN